MILKTAFRIVTIVGATLPLWITLFAVGYLGYPMSIVWPTVCLATVLLYPFLYVAASEHLWRTIVERR